jgi:hypothetical protein
MSESTDTKNMSGETAEEKRSACGRDNDEMPSESHREPRERSQSVCAKSSNGISSDAARPPLNLAVLQTIEIINELQPASNKNDDHCSLDECEQVAGHSSMANSSVVDSEKCSICFETFKTQAVGTPDICDHTFCTACLQKWLKNKTTCPVDRQTVNFIIVRQHLGGKIIKRIRVKRSRQKRRVCPSNRNYIFLLSFICIALILMVFRDISFQLKFHARNHTAPTQEV